MISDQLVAGQSPVSVKRIAVNAAIITTAGATRLASATVSDKLVIGNVKLSLFEQVSDINATDVYSPVVEVVPVVTAKVMQSGVMVMATIPSSVNISEAKVVGVFAADGTLIAVCDIASTVVSLTQNDECVIEIALPTVDAGVITA